VRRIARGQRDLQASTISLAGVGRRNEWEAVIDALSFFTADA
jgi:hypothetical protein